MVIIVLNVLKELFSILQAKNVFMYVDKILPMIQLSLNVFACQFMVFIKINVLNVHQHSLYRTTIVLPVQMIQHTIQPQKDAFAMMDF